MTTLTTIVMLNLFQDLKPQAQRSLPEMLKRVQHDEFPWELANA